MTNTTSPWTRKNPKDYESNKVVKAKFPTWLSYMWSCFEICLAVLEKKYMQTHFVLNRQTKGTKPTLYPTNLIVYAKGKKTKYHLDCKGLKHTLLYVHCLEEWLILYQWLLTSCMSLNFSNKLCICVFWCFQHTMP